MPNTPSDTLTPSRKQLAYLRQLAQRAGQTFTTPRTRLQASAEIRRLQAIRTTGFTFAELEAERVARELNDDLTSLHQTVRGLRIRAERCLEPAVMTATATTDTSAAAPTVGELRELARYTTGIGIERVLGGQRVDGVVVVTDYALAGGERSYLVEQGLEQEGHGANAALNALIADYLTQVERYDDCPMRHTAVEAVLTETTGESR